MIVFGQSDAQSLRLMRTTACRSAILWAGTTKVRSNVFGKIYNISVAVLAVNLVLLVIGGGLFTVIQGLVAFFV